MNVRKRQYYSLVQRAQAVYRESGNISAFLRDEFSLKSNTPEIVEISYDLQAGSYVKSFYQNFDRRISYCAEVASYLNDYLTPDSSMVEVGCGEATTMSGVCQKLALAPKEVGGFDLSFSRIDVALDHWKKQQALASSPSHVPTANLFVADLFHIPLASKSVDIIYTSHSIEPNGGRELEALQSIFRVAKKRVLLFEPYFEAASAEGQQRMLSHGYVKDIPEAIEKAGGVLHNLVKIENVDNALNPTYLFDIEVSPALPNVQDNVSRKTPSLSWAWADPITLETLQERDGYYFCSISGLAYPILASIPCLKPENAILATRLMGRR